MTQFKQLLDHILLSAKRILNDKKGAAMILFAFVLLFFVTFPLSMFQIDMMLAVEEQKHIERAAVVSALAALYNVSVDTDLSDFQKDDITNRFKYFLKKNLNLDDNFVPTSGPIKDPITIEEITVYDGNDVPATCSWGKEINYPGIHVVLLTRIHRNYMADVFGDYITIRIHKDIDIFETGAGQ
ncbi:hypothetical protein [Anaerocellum danielii]|uniref:Flp pilus assembly protein TadG n=1 Tax=Anaerocellum danielii TaxID=1387557 RepID=A0ABZ0TXJ6_9FIRM|nr:hypothetical protein [Caldicellulosiruptor danielii]WPX08157.1 hypothetical protein SOJ16_002023 [Caldicellulosiruptor danielii]